MPQEDELWDFPIPDAVVERTIHCPNGITCPAEERFSTSWLDLLEDREPNSDSVIADKMRPVYANLGQGTRALGACNDVQGEPRVLLRIPLGIGASLPWYREVNAERIAVDEDYAKRVSFERNEAMLWSAQHQQPLYIGPCTQVDDDVRKIYGNSVLAVSARWYTTQAAQNTAARQPFATPTAVLRPSGSTTQLSSPATGNVQATPTPSPTAVPSSAPTVVNSTSENTFQASGPSVISVGSSWYNLVGVAHDRNCGGNFVIGTVTNANGQAVAGVRVLYSDQFGNRIETVTSGQMPGYGSFRFAIGGDAPQTINVTLLGSNGAAISPTASVPHMQGNQTDLGCHYTIWKGAD
jgi:hypothetical protein